MVSAAERAINLLLVLLSSERAGFTRNQLREAVYPEDSATSWQAWERKFSRDKKILRDCGIPLETYSSDDVEYYRINQDALFLPDVEFSEKELQVLAQAQGLWQNTPINSAVLTALNQLNPAGDIIATQPVATTVGLVDERIPQLVAACQHHEVLGFRYRAVNAAGSTQRRVRAWGMFLHQQHWYVVGFDYDRSAQRTFRLSRIEEQNITINAPTRVQNTDSSLPPEGFSLARVQAELAPEHNEHRLVLWLSQGQGLGLRIHGEATGKVDECSHSSQYVFSVDSLEPLAQHILASGGVEAIETGDSAEAFTQLLKDYSRSIRELHQQENTTEVPTLDPVIQRRNRASETDRVSRLLAILTMAHRQGSVDQQEILQRFDIDKKTLAQDLRVLRLESFDPADWSLAQERFDVIDDSEHIEVLNAERFSKPLRLSTPQAYALNTGLKLLGSRLSPESTQHDVVTSLEKKLSQLIGHGKSDQLSSEYVSGELASSEYRERLEAILRAIDTKAQIEFDYYSRSSQNISHRVVDPQQLVYGLGHSYLRGYCHQATGARTFRLDRMRNITVGSPHTVQRAHAKVGGSITPVAQYQFSAVVHFAYRVRDVATGYRPVATKALDDGSLLAEIQFIDDTALFTLVAQAPGAIRVVEPRPIIDKVLEHFDWA